MRDKRTRLFIALLAAAAAASALAVVLFLAAERLQSVHARIGRLEARLHLLHESLPAETDMDARRARLHTALSERRRRFYGPAETTPYSFGLRVRRMLEEQGLAVLRYQVVEGGGKSLLELSVAGPPQSLLCFLREVSRMQKYCSIPSFRLIVGEGGRRVDVTFRIGYEALDAGDI